MNTIETVLSYTTQIEGLLEQRLGASGRGLHEKASSVEDRLSFEIIKKIRYIATIRNRAVHEHGFQLPDTADLAAVCDEVVAFLQQFSPKPKPSTQDWVIAPAEKQKFQLFGGKIRLRKAATLLLAIASCLWAWHFVGIGAGFLAFIVGYIAGSILLSKEALEIYLGAIVFLVLILILAAVVYVITKLWSMGKLA